MRQVSAIIAILLLSCVPCLHAQQHDPAYVDSPANRAQPDPARADAVAVARASSGRAATAVHDERSQAEQFALTQQRIAAQMEQFAAAQAAAQAQRLGSADEGYADPPIGGRSLIREVEGYAVASRELSYDRPMAAGAPRMPSPPSAQPTTPAQQIGLGLLQDTAGLADSHLQRKIGGEHGRVILPRYDIGEAPPPGP